MRSMDEGHPIVGREPELAQVAELLRGDRPVAVVGEAGIGKTTLIRAAAAAAGRPLREGGSFATLAWLPYFALQRATGLTLVGDPELVAARVERTIGPDVLFVDDLQWTDPATRAVVGLLVDRVAIVVAVRQGDAATAETLEPLLARRVAVVPLEGLPDDDALVLARHLHRDAPIGALRRVVGRAGGNPLLLSELASRGSSSSSLARAILGQLEALSAADRRALEVIAVAERPLPENEIGPSAARLLAQGLVQRQPDGLAVRHSLIAEAIVGQLDDGRRRDIHARLAEVLTDPAQRARHLAAAGNRTAAFEVAASALESSPDPRNRAVLLAVAAESSTADGSAWRVRAARQLTAVGSPQEAITLLLGAPLEGDDDLRASGAAILAGSLDQVGRNDDAWAVIEDARDLRPPAESDGAVELGIIESLVLVNRGRLDDAIAILERAAASLGDVARYPRLTGHLASLRLYAGRTDRLDDLEAAVDASLAAGDGGTAAGRAMDLYYMTLAMRGAAAAATVADDAAARLERLGYHTRSAELRAEAAQAVIFAGALGPAVVRVDEMLEAPLGLLARQRLGYNRGLALGLMGRFEEAERTFAEFEPDATDSFDGRGALLWCWAEASLWSGQSARALDLASRSLAFTAFNDAELVLPSLARAWAEADLGRPPTTAAVEVPFPALAGAAPELRGLEALHRDHLVDATDAFDEAAGRWAGFNRPRELVCRWAASEARRRSGDGPSVVPALEAVLNDASAIGFEPLAARVRRSLRLAGVRISAPRGRGPIVELTAREAEVVRLVEQGLSNPEIARRLGLGRPTVARMVTSAMDKVGVGRRAQLAARELV